MEFKEYEARAASTALYKGFGTSEGLSYCTLGLAGEAGEVANKVKKILRGDYDFNLAPARAAIADELGDALWYIAEVGRNIGFTLEEIAERNVAKLAGRQTRSVVKGSGDNR